MPTTVGTGNNTGLPDGTKIGDTADVNNEKVQRVQIDLLAAAGAAPSPVTAANPMPVTGPVTDAQLRAAPVPVSGPVTDAQMRATAVPVSGPLTDAQLRAAAVPVSAASLPLPSGAATDGAPITGQVLETGGSTIMGWLSSIRKAITDRLGTLGQKTMAASTPVAIASDQSSVSIKDSAGNAITATALGQAAMVASLPVAIASDQTAVPVSGPVTDAQLRATAVPVSGPVTDAQLRATAVPVSGPLTDAQLRATAVPVSAASLPLPTGAATDGVAIDGQSLETGGSTILGWLSSIRKAITDRLPAALVGGRLDVNVGAALPAGTNNIGDVDIVAPLSAVSATGTLGALNDTLVLALQGRPAVGIVIIPGTFNGQIGIEYSPDGGATWEEKLFFNGDDMVGLDTIPTPDGADSVTRQYTVYPNAAEGHIRLKVFTYNSGSCTAYITASATIDPAASRVVAITFGDATLGALNDAVEISTSFGTQSVGFAIDAGTFAGTLVVEPSSDGGRTWGEAIYFWMGFEWRNSLVLTSPSDRRDISIPNIAINNRFRLRVSVYASGTLVARGRASAALDVIAARLDGGIDTLGAPAFSTAIAGKDGTTHRAIAVKIASPAATDAGLVTRNLPLKAATATAHASTAVEGAAVSLLASNAARKRFMVQNAGTVPVKLGFGSTDPTATSYHIALAGGSVADDGTGDTYIDDMWTGAVEAIGATGGKVVVTELT